jgi:hypothetical protein
MSSMHQIVEAAVSGRVALIVPNTDLGVLLFRVPLGQEVPIELQRQIWRVHGRFYVSDGKVKVHPAWVVVKHPETDEASQIRTVYGQKVTACYSRPGEPVPDPFNSLPSWMDFG